MSNVYGWYAWIDASVSYPSDETATVTWSAGFGSGNNWRYEISPDASWNMGGHTGSVQWKFIVCEAHSRATMASGSFNVSRGSGDQQVGLSFHIDRASSGFRPGTADAATSVNVAAYPYILPEKPSGVTVKRVSDTQAVVSWTNGAVSSARNARERIEVWRWTDNALQTDPDADRSRVWLANVGADATSYTDSTVSANHHYQYAVFSYNKAGWNGLQSSNRISMTPAPPAGITLSRTTDYAVSAVVDNSGNITGTSTRIRYSVDGKKTWKDCADTIAASGSDAVSYSFAAAGTVWVEAANVVTEGGATLTSAWTVSEQNVVTVTPPLAPTLLSPAMSSIVSTSAAGIVFTWKHNPLDGSAQSAADVAYSTDDGANWNILHIAGEGQSKAISMSFSDNTKITWKARTKGIDADFGPWSPTGIFRIYSAPTVTILQPSAAVTDLPVLVKWKFTSATGSQASASVTATCGGNRKTYNVTTSDRIAIDVGDGLLVDGGTLKVEVRATGTTTLSATATASQSVSYTAPIPPQAAVQIAEHNASASIVPYPGTSKPDSTKEYPAAVSFSVARISKDGTREEIASSLAAYGSVTDYAPPLDVETTYRVTATARNGASSHTDLKATVPSGGCAFVTFGSSVAKLRYKVSHTEGSSPSVTLFEAAGRANPRAFHGRLNTRNDTLTGTIFNDSWDEKRVYDPHDEEELESTWKKLQAWRGDIYVRLPYIAGRTVKAAKTKLDITYDEGAAWWMPVASLEYTEVG
ncbi:MAG: fibronectin type III domain-containing protein [Atopobiaceae bacterium]|nr:fibronectin type III domain-containing protein [Atopobiaceae bacterium]